jgi:group I intron endonuclease
MPGVYAIIHNALGNRYIGSARRTFGERWAEHHRALRQGAHSSPLLQRDFTTFGPEAFAFLVLIICEPYECVRYEQFFLDRCRRDGTLYNANPFADSVFSDLPLRGYLSPAAAIKEREELRELNALFKAMRAEGIPFDEAWRIARALTVAPVEDQ